MITFLWNFDKGFMRQNEITIFQEPIKLDFPAIFLDHTLHKIAKWVGLLDVIEEIVDDIG